MTLTNRILAFLVFFIFSASLATAEQEPSSNTADPDVILIGGGIMSATLASLLHELDSNLKIEIYERLDNLAFESSGTLNNAGTGHAALSELNYTPRRSDGSIDTTKAVQVNEDFEISKQFWSYLASSGRLSDPREFIHAVPHLSWVHGQKNVQFLGDRFRALRRIPLFQDMQYTENPDVLRKWIPVIMKDRAPGEPMAATRSFQGTDVDYGRLTTMLFQNLIDSHGAAAYVSHEVQNIQKMPSGRWQLTIKDIRSGAKKRVRAKFVFIGAGGGTLPLLQKTGLPEADGYGGFPVGGEFLIYKGTDLAEQHLGKVYGQAPVGAPPMSVPHLDTRVIDGKKRLIFGPFAGATTRFLKEGSPLDLVQSVKLGNINAMLRAGSQNMALIRYLIDQETQTHEDRMLALREFVPNARSDEWEIVDAGVRVQIVKHSGHGESALRFGTEVVTAKDGTLAALLGASPGASTSVAAMLEVLRGTEFASQMDSIPWRTKLRAMIPSYGLSLSTDEALLRTVRDESARALKLGSVTCESLFTAQ